MDNNVLNLTKEQEDILEKYPNLKPVYNHETGNYYFKYCIDNKETLIKDLKSLSLTKDMAVFNIKKYGYESEKKEILKALGF